MARLNVNPTRMQLTNLKRRLKTATRGHKLLKDKQDELMRQFIALVRNNKKLREEVEKELSDCFIDFQLSSALMNKKILGASLSMSKQKLSCSIEEKNVMSVIVPIMEFKRKKSPGGILPYGYAQTSSELDSAVMKLDAIMDRLLELSRVEKTCQLMADEIEKTRRRVNALEYRTIPDLEETIKYIRMKLDENERATITRLMKVKDIIEKQE